MWLLLSNAMQHFKQNQTSNIKTCAYFSGVIPRCPMFMSANQLISLNDSPNKYVA